MWFSLSLIYTNPTAFLKPLAQKNTSINRYINGNLILELSPNWLIFCFYFFMIPIYFHTHRFSYNNSCIVATIAYNELMTNKTLSSPIERFTRILFSKVIERLAVVVSEEHLSFSQVAALHVIDREDKVNINDISIRLNLSMSATSRMIDVLVKKKLIKRKEVQDNRRSKSLTLTISGEKFMDTLSIERVKIIEQSAASITDRVPLKILNIVSRKLFSGKSDEKL